MKKYLLLSLVFIGCSWEIISDEDQLIQESINLGCNDYRVITMIVIIPKQGNNSSYVKSITTKACVISETAMMINPGKPVLPTTYVEPNQTPMLEKTTSSPTYGEE